MPIFWQGALVMLAANKAHHLDIGGKDPGSWSADARNTYQEGLCLPALRLARGGAMNEEVVEILMANLRTPTLSRGDFAAQIAALKTAELRTHEWLEKNGVELLTQTVDALLDHGERVVRSAIESIPDGVYRASGFADGDGVSDEPIPIAVTVTVEGGDIHIDYTGSGAQREGSAGNAHWVVTVSMTRQAMMFFTDTALGGNEGSYRPIHVTAPPGCVFNPEYPAPVTTGMGNMGTRLIELIFQALADVVPDEVIGGTFGCFSCMTLGGKDPTTDGEFVHFECYSGGWGGRRHADGNSATVSLGSGDAYNIPVEVMETTTPILLCEKFALQEGSAGAGRHRGGFGTEIDYRMMGEAELAIALDRETFKPYGLFGGQEGQGSELLVGAGHAVGGALRAGERREGGRRRARPSPDGGRRRLRRAERARSGPGRRRLPERADHAGGGALALSGRDRPRDPRARPRCHRRAPQGRVRPRGHAAAGFRGGERTQRADVRPDDQ